MSKQLKIILAIIGVIGITTLVYIWYLSGNEEADGKYKEIISREGPSIRAIKYRYLAAGRLLRKYGLDVSLGKRLPEEPGRHDMIILNKERLPIFKAESEYLLSWVSNGGVLICTPDIREERDPLLERFQVSLAEKRKYDSIRIKLPREAWFYDKDYRRGRKHNLEMNNFHLDPPGGYRHFKSDYTARLVYSQPDKGPFVIKRYFGYGTVILLGDADFFDNDFITVDDHAAFFLDLVYKNMVPGNKIRIIDYQKIESIFSYIYRYAYLLVFTLVLLLLIWILHARYRRGPMLPDKENIRRSLLEHVRATGLHYAGHRQYDQLMASVMNDLYSTVKRRGIDRGDARGNVLAGRLKPLSTMSEEELKDLLKQKKNISPQYFYSAVRRLQKLKKEITKQGAKKNG